MEKGIKYSWYSPEQINDKMLEQMANLYSNHYGKWGPNGVHPGKNIKLSAKKLSEWIKSKYSRVAIAEKDSQIIGYAIAVQKNIDGNDIVS